MGSVVDPLTSILIGCISPMNRRRLLSDILRSILTFTSAPLKCSCYSLTLTPPTQPASPSKPLPFPSPPLITLHPKVPLFHYSNLSGINVIPNPAILQSTPDWFHSGQFPFYPVDISGLRSRFCRCIGIGNAIHDQSPLSSQHRRTFHICIHRRER